MIRPVRKEDAPAIQKICETALGYPTPLSLIESRIEALSGDPSLYFAVYEEEESRSVLGIIEAERYEVFYEKSGWNLLSLAVLPKAQKQGVGKALLWSLEEFIQREGGAFLRLNSRIDREDAHGFYEHLGYCCDKTQKRFIKTFTEQKSG